DGTSLACTGRSGTVKLWNLGPSAGSRHLVQKTGFKRVALSPDGRWLAGATIQGLVQVWDLAAGRKVHDLAGQFGSGSVVCFSPDGRLLATGGAGNQIRLWETASGKLLFGLPDRKESTGWVSGLAFSPDG